MAVYQTQRLASEGHRPACRMAVKRPPVWARYLPRLAGLLLAVTVGLAVACSPTLSVSGAPSAAWSLLGAWHIIAGVPGGANALPESVAALGQGTRATATATAPDTATPTPAATFTTLPTATRLPTGTPPPTETPLPTATPTATNTPEPTATPLPTNTPVPPTAAPLPTEAPTEPPAPAPTAIAVSADAPAAGPPTRIQATSIGLDVPVIEMGYRIVEVSGIRGTLWDVPVNAAGWHSNTSLPGHAGNMVISGHSSGGGEVFRWLEKLSLGDFITVYVGESAYQYQVAQREIVREQGASIEERRANGQWIKPGGDERLTLITCYPYPTSANRLIIVATPI